MLQWRPHGRLQDAWPCTATSHKERWRDPHGPAAHSKQQPFTPQALTALRLLARSHSKQHPQHTSHNCLCIW
jgi:hypothetical protein